MKDYLAILRIHIKIGNMNIMQTKSSSKAGISQHGLVAPEICSLFLLRLP